MDIWQTFSIALIFLALLEYSFVSYFVTRKIFGECEHRKQERREREEEERRKDDGMVGGMHVGWSSWVKNYECLLILELKAQRKVNRTCRQHHPSFAIPLSKSRPEPKSSSRGWTDEPRPCRKCQWRDEMIANRIDWCKYCIV